MAYKETYKIIGTDADANDIVRGSAILKYMQETANRQMRAYGPSYSELFQKGMAFVLSRMRVINYDILHPYDEITVETWPSESTGLTFPRFYKILRDDKIISEGASMWALLDTKNHRLMRATEVDISSYPFGDPLDIPLRFRIPTNVPLEDAKAHTVEYSEIDCNRHMNNTNYPDILCNRIPDVENKIIKEFTISFLSEALYGETLDIKRCKEISEDGNEIYYFRTTKGDKTNIEAKGLGIIQEATLEYEPDLVVRLIQPGSETSYPVGEITKSRYDMFTRGEIYTFTPKVWQDLRAWLEEGADADKILEEQRQDYIKDCKAILDTNSMKRPIWQVKKEDLGYKDVKLEDLPLDALKMLYAVII